MEKVPEPCNKKVFEKYLKVFEISNTFQKYLDTNTKYFDILEKYLDTNTKYSKKYLQIPNTNTNTKYRNNSDVHHNVRFHENRLSHL